MSEYLRSTNICLRMKKIIYKKATLKRTVRFEIRSKNIILEN